MTDPIHIYPGKWYGHFPAKAWALASLVRSYRKDGRGAWGTALCICAENLTGMHFAIATEGPTVRSWRES